MSNSVDQIALRSIFVIVSVIGLVCIGWYFIPIVSEKVSDWTSGITFSWREKPEPSPAPQLEPAAPSPTPIPAPEFISKRLSSPVAVRPRVSPPVVRKQSTPGIQPEIRKALPVALRAERIVRPVPPPSEVWVEIPSKGWSEPIVVPVGKIPVFSFSLGRIEIERNGASIGVFFRNPTVTANQREPSIITGKIAPFAMLDKEPRTLEFDAETRVLRLRSLERRSESVLVEFR
jgi:hypothetical protein